MNEKLLLQDLVDLLSKKAGITKKEADFFLRELFQLILERIFDNEQIKIKDFGTFKLILLSNRESVNVNTGEKIEIPAHYKLSFLPDKVLKDLVNKPFAHFETVLMEDGDLSDGIVKADFSYQNIEQKIQPKLTERDNEDEANENMSVEEEDISLPRKELSDCSIEPIVVLSGAIEEIQKEDLCTEFDNEYDDFDLETEDGISRVFQPIKSNMKQKDRSSEEQNIAYNSPLEGDSAYLLDNPDRPLVPIEDIVDDTKVVFEPVEHKELSQEQEDKKEHAEDNVPKNRDVAYSEDIDIPDYDYEKSSRISKLKRQVLITLSVLAIAGFAGYQFYQLFNSNPAPKIYTPRKELTLMDTLILMQDTDQPGMSLDSNQKQAFSEQVKGVVEGVSVDEPAEKEIENLSENRIEENNLENASNVNVDSLQMALPKRKLSERLQIEVVDKGAYHVVKYPPKEPVLSTVESREEAVNQEVVKPSKERYVTFKRGNTLMNLSLAYYGNKVYWVYIYQANKDKIHNPDAVSIGTRVLMPYLEDYGVTNSRDPRSISKAKTLESTILSRYKY